MAGGAPQDTQPTLPDPNQNAQPKSYIEKFRDRPRTKFVDPCEDAAKASLTCMDHHSYDRDKCSDFFQVYRDCKKQWMEERKADRRAGRPVK
ncbi:hypothetical protein PHLCEN_2v11296 [Hermanssonia centrifuga]|uniref:Cytochrome c oxidase-assembly factor COX23, mitochondrial n=1 Tax=Hermanssonia centrifuga TaxID=98765 RepID=A0A2R6NK98_9APHY|nr:hypothetical protein PHLCEN_2v11296 [Hermanssonia centrifuga]